MRGVSPVTPDLERSSAEVLGGRDVGSGAASEDTAGLVARWVAGWDGAQQRAAAQLVDTKASLAHGSGVHIGFGGHGLSGTGPT